MSTVRLQTVPPYCRMLKTEMDGIKKVKNTYLVLYIQNSFTVYKECTYIDFTCPH
jgi:hypothetical protein